MHCLQTLGGLAIATMLALPPAYASNLSAIDLMGSCEKNDEFCTAYIAGYVDGNLARRIEGLDYCLPPHTISELKSVFELYIKRHPKFRDEDLGIVMGLALRDEYPGPCK